MPSLLPISAIVPTRNRRQALEQTLFSLAQQSVQPSEMVIIDASTNSETQTLCENGIPNLLTDLIYVRATQIGAATQRNQGILYASQETIWLLDDDVIFEIGCLERLWNGLYSDPTLGGVNAMITNQRYETPGKVSRTLFRLLHGKHENSYAGKCIGPALNLLPEDHQELPEVVPVEWLNTTCTVYRRKALPEPLFSSMFIGYSLMEDVTLSLTVSRNWKLANARTARIFHNSQPGEHKSDLFVLSKMELVNRHYVMTTVLGRKRVVDYLKLALLQVFNLVAHISTQGLRDVPTILQGKFAASKAILTKNS